MGHGTLFNLRGSRVRGEADDPEPLSTYGAGRTCGAPGCGTLLSRYNPSGFCCLHHGWAETPAHARVRVEREAQIRTCLLASCGREFVTENPAKRYCTDHCRMKAFTARQVGQQDQSIAV